MGSHVTVASFCCLSRPPPLVFGALSGHVTMLVKAVVWSTSDSQLDILDRFGRSFSVFFPEFIVFQGWTRLDFICFQFLLPFCDLYLL